RISACSLFTTAAYNSRQPPPMPGGGPGPGPAHAYDVEFSGSVKVSTLARGKVFATGKVHGKPGDRSAIWSEELFTATRGTGPGAAARGGTRDPQSWPSPLL